MVNPTTTPIMTPATGPGNQLANPIYIVDIYGNPLTGSGFPVTVTNANANGQNVMANSAPVVLASDQSAIPTKTAFLEVAGQGPGVVNAINTDLIPATDVSAYRWFSLQVAGSWSAQLTAQCSNDNLNWQSVTLQETTTATSATFLSFSSNGVYDAPIKFRFLRVRATAWTSNASMAGTLELYTVPSAPLAMYVIPSGGSTALQVSPTGGSTDFHLVSAASNNATNIKNVAGQVYGYEIYNANAAVRFVKLYNKATTPAPATDVPFRTIGVPPNGRAFFHTSTGLAMANGIGIATVTGIADTDNTSVGAADLVIDIDYK